MVTGREFATRFVGKAQKTTPQREHHFKMLALLWSVGLTLYSRIIVALRSIELIMNRNLGAPYIAKTHRNHHVVRQSNSNRTPSLLRTRLDGATRLHLNFFEFLGPTIRIAFGLGALTDVRACV